MSTAKVFVGSLPPGCKPDELRRLFSNYGAVVECDVMNRCGFVHLENTDMAEAAIAALNGIEFKGQNIVVEPGRPKERGRKGVGATAGQGPGAGNRGGRRPAQQGHGHGGESNKGPLESGSNHRGQNNFGRVAGGRGGGGSDARDSISNGNNFGPIRNERNYGQQRNAPYSKGPQQQQSHHTEGSAQGFKNRFSAGGSGGPNRFGGSGGGGAGNFNSSPGNRFGGHNQQFQQWDNLSGSHTNNVQGGGRRNFKSSPSSGFSGNNQHNDFQSGYSTSGGGGGSIAGTGSQRGGGLGPSNNVRQDRRGFALPAVDHHHQQQQQPVSFGGNQSGRFGNGLGPMRSDNPVINSGNHQGGRSGFSPNRGNFGGRGGFNARPSNNERGMSQNQGPGGGFNKRGGPSHSQNKNALTAYQTEFPPLGSSHGPGGGGPGQRNRFNGPRHGPGPNMAGNRRF